MNLDAPLFISCFLPLLAVIYWLIPGEKGRNIVLLVAGLVFYAFGSLQGLGLLLLAAVVNYLLGLLLLKQRGRKAVRTVAVTANLLFLAGFKYLDFLLGDILGLPKLELGLAAPVGISFFTFKCISYIVDTYRDKGMGTKRFFDFLLYISFFPQVMAGPISRFSDFRPQLARRDCNQAAPGLRRFVIGLAKKLIFAGTLSQIADAVFALEAGTLDFRVAWLGAAAYTLQIYFDFSGYSDMAIGLGQFFGFRTPENFRYPYVGDSITDFWRRWHISLSSWFRDYLYIPLGGNRKGKWRTALNKLIVFTLCGVWHGAAWTFVLWGLWHGLLSALESLGAVAPKRWRWKWLGHVYTLLAVCLGFVLFRAETVGGGFRILAAMFTGFSITEAGTVALGVIGNTEALWTVAAGTVLCLPWVQWMKAKPKLWKIAEPASYVGVLALFVLCLMKLAAGGFAPFIYSQF